MAAADGDAEVLSVCAALEPLLAATPPPLEQQVCEGCTPAVKVVPVTWDGQGTPAETDTTSIYELHLNGKCILQSSM